MLNFARIRNISQRLLILLLLSAALLQLPLTALASEKLENSSEQVAKGLLWKITSAEGDAGYLFGTIHSEDARVLEFPQVLLDALKASPIFAMELVPNLPTIGKLMQAMRYQDGSLLEDKIGKELYLQVAARLVDYGVPASEAQSLKVWAAAMTLSVPVPETGMFLDFSLSLRAAAGGATITALETLDEQVGFLQALDEKNQILMLQQVVAEFADMQTQNLEMVDLWLGRDLNALAEMSRVQMAEMEPQLADWFQVQGIDKRNVVMLRRALPLLRQGGIFIAVGALHLPGNAGLIAGIREAGFELEAVW